MSKLYARLLFCLPSVLLALVWACNEKKPTTTKSSEETAAEEQPATVWMKDSLFKDQSLSYFLPSSAPASPVCLIFFDPQGEGWEPVSLYKNLAANHGFVLVGSNFSKNGMDIEEDKAIVNQLIERINQESGLDSARYYAAGFSGGARVALHLLLLNTGFRGAVYAGAPGNLAVYQKPVFGFAGNRDMNYADLLAFDGQLANQGSHFLREWEGRHEWPSESVMEEAFNWLHIREIKQPSRFDSTLKSLEKKWKSEKNILKKAMYMKQSDFLKEAFSGSRSKSKILEDLENSAVWIKETSIRNEELSKELGLKESYGRAFFEKDTLWWKSEIAAMQKGSRYPEKNMQQRLLGYFSLAGYSLAHRALQENQWDLLEKILFIYRQSDPENAEAWYLTALLNAREQKTEVAISNLQQCKKLGFRDQERYEKETAFRFIRDKAAVSFR